MDGCALSTVHPGACFQASPIAYPGMSTITHLSVSSTMYLGVLCIAYPLHVWVSHHHIFGGVCYLLHIPACYLCIHAHYPHFMDVLSQLVLFFMAHSTILTLFTD